MPTKTATVGLDLSLTSTGVAEVWPDGRALTKTFGSKGPKKGDPVTVYSRDERLGKLASLIVGYTYDVQPAMALIEAHSFDSVGGSAHDRSGLWWMVVSKLIDLDITVVEVTTSQLKKFATGKGNTKKELVVIEMTRRYPMVEFKTNDEADALALAAIGAYKLGSPLVELPKINLEPLDTVHWPEGL